MIPQFGIPDISLYRFIKEDTIELGKSILERHALRYGRTFEELSKSCKWNYEAIARMTEEMSAKLVRNEIRCSECKNYKCKRSWNAKCDEYE